jgi:hypothetical protein
VLRSAGTGHPDCIAARTRDKFRPTSQREKAATVHCLVTSSARGWQLLSDTAMRKERKEEETGNKDDRGNNRRN